jgi:hypothetical protein
VWEVYLTDEVDRWLDELAVTDSGSHRQAVFAIEALVEGGPNLVDRWWIGSKGPRSTI